MNQVRNLAVLIFCALFAFSPALQAMGGKKVSGGSRDVASERDIASVEHESKGVPQLITYDELKKLSPEARAEYIAGVREMIVQLAARGGKDFPMFAGGKSLKETYSLLEALLPEAQAQYTNNRTNAADIRPRYERRQYINNFEKWTCDSSEAIFDYNVGTCIHKSGKTATLLSPCPGGYKSAYLKNGLIARAIGSPSTKYCVPSGSWSDLAPSRRAELSRDTGAESVASYFATRLMGNDKQIGAEIALGGTPKASASAPHLTVPTKDPLRGGDYGCYSTNSKVQYNADIGTCTSSEISRTANCPANDWKRVILVKPGWTDMQRKYFCVTPASWRQLSEKRQIDLTEPVGANAASAADREQAATGSGRRSYAAVEVTLPETRPAATVDAPNDNPATPVVERSQAEEIVQGGAPCAGISKMTCGDKSQRAAKRAAAKEWWQKNSNVCVFGGNISSFSSEDQKDKTCASVYSFSKPKLHCTAGVICNPIVFGAKEDGSAYCSTKYAEATSDCNAQAASPNKWLEANVSSVKDEWNKLRSGMMAACGRNAVREYFCDECNIMMERLASLRLLAFEKGSDGICHAPLAAYENAVTTLKPAAPAAAQPAKQ